MHVVAYLVWTIENIDFYLKLTGNLIGKILNILNECFWETDVLVEFNDILNCFFRTYSEKS
jgi:hypothetical protein